VNAPILLLSILAVYRAARMISQDGEDGPFDVLAWWRDWIGQSTWIGRGFHCFYCVSFWAGLVAALWLCAFGMIGWAMLPLLWFGLSAGAMIIFKVIK
jgi:hypothetical protein